MRSLRGKLLTLPEDVVVFPGHGPQTTIGEERETNPFCGGCRTPRTRRFVAAGDGQT